MKIAYWNVCNASSPEAISAECRRMQQDGVEVFCLQETPYTQPGNTPASDIIAPTLDMIPDFHHTRTLSMSKDGKKIKGYGTAILTPNKQGEYWTLQSAQLESGPIHKQFQNLDEPFGRGHRRALGVAYNEADPEVAIAVAHLSYKLPLGIGKAAISQENDRLLGYLETLAQEKQVVFGGDLNRQPDDGLDEELANIAYRLASPTDVPTFRSRHWYAGHVERNLDRVFVTEGLAATAVLGSYGPSDHRPVIVDIEKR